MQEETTFQPEVLRSDRGSDFTSGEFENFILERGIEHQFATPDGHGATGRAERLIRTLNDGARTMMIRSGAPHKYFMYAVTMMHGIKTRTSSKGQPSPYEMAIGTNQEIYQTAYLGSQRWL